MYEIAPNLVATVRNAAQDAWSIFRRIGPVVRALSDDDLIAMGIPANAVPACRVCDDAMGESLIARFDFALTDDGPKVLELNAETPFLLWESHEISGAVATALGFDDPNAGALAHLIATLRSVLRDLSAHARIASTAMNAYREDWFTAVFMARMLGAATGRSAAALALGDLSVRDGKLRDLDGAPIDVLWRCYPLEHFAHDSGGTAFLRLVERGALRLLNPPTALLAQTKATLALIWGVAQSPDVFSEREREIIRRLFLPTYLECPADERVYVRKPTLGREGNTVSIVRGEATLTQAFAHTYRRQEMVYQEFVTLPTVTCRLPDGRIHRGTAVITCFVVGGVAGPIGMRVGGTITDAWAHFLPIGVRRPQPALPPP